MNTIKENIEALQDELNSVEGQIDMVLDQMLEKYGKFISLGDLDGKDSYKKVLSSSYDYLLRRRQELQEHINSLIY